MTCSTGDLVAATQIKVPGSPDIVQPISLTATPNQVLSVDVLKQYVTAGVDKAGVTKPVVAESLKVVDGPATIKNGQVEITAGARRLDNTRHLRGVRG